LLSKILEDILTIKPSEYTELEKLCSESIAKLKAECSWTESEIQKITHDSMMNMYMTFVNERLLNDKRLDQVSLGIGKLLSEHSRAILLMRQIQEELDAEFDAHIDKFRNDLKQNYRVRSRVSEWFNDCVQNEAVKKSFNYFRFDFNNLNGNFSKRKNSIKPTHTRRTR
jgi:hypothetical protein